MKGRIGYVRVSTVEQNTDRQLEGQTLDKIFTDKVSGKSLERPGLQNLLEFVREGDTVVVHSMDRLARNLDDLKGLVQGLTKKGVRVEFLKEGLSFTGDDTPLANLLLNVMGAFAEFERALIRERQLEGIAIAKQRGAYRGRREAFTPDQALEIQRRIGFGESKAALAREFGVHRSTVYEYLEADQDERQCKKAKAGQGKAEARLEGAAAEGACCS